MLLALVLLAEILLVSVWLDGASLTGTAPLTRVVRDWGATAVRGAAVAVLFWFVLGDGRRPVIGFPAEPIRRDLLLFHALLFGGFLLLSSVLFTAGAAGNRVAAVWILAGAASTAVLFTAFVPLQYAVALGRSTAETWLFGAGAAAASLLLGSLARNWWEPAAAAVFRAVQLTLSPLRPDIAFDAAERTIGTSRFAVRIAPECSGLEGIGLVLTFCGAFLWFRRSELRFPHALLLIPAGVAGVWLLNAFRIALLLLIGDGGAPAVAAGGFHSQAGWIAFCSVVLCLAWAARHVPLFQVHSGARALSGGSSADGTAAHLLPFLAILAAALVSGAASGGFEWLYPVRAAAAAAVLYRFRRELRKLNREVSSASLLLGAGVFLLWIALEPLAGEPNSGSATGAALGTLSPLARFAWLAARVAAATVTVPIAEELAFRSWLLRRLISERFEEVSPTCFRPAAFLLSSLAFGLLHGERWLAGTLAGMGYAWAYQRRGSIGDAVVAHAATNALLAGFVLFTGRFELW